VKAVGRKDVTAENVRRELAANPAYDLNIYAYVLDNVPTHGPAPRYGVTYDDISTTRRMPWHEEHRKAVCGKIACTV